MTRPTSSRHGRRVVATQLDSGTSFVEPVGARGRIPWCEDVRRRSGPQLRGVCVHVVGKLGDDRCGLLCARRTGDPFGRRRGGLRPHVRVARHRRHRRAERLAVLEHHDRRKRVARWHPGPSHASRAAFGGRKTAPPPRKGVVQLGCSFTLLVGRETLPGGT
jgi:hypothetical protein